MIEWSSEYNDASKCVKPIVYTKGRGQGLERKALGLFVVTSKEHGMGKGFINTQSKVILIKGIAKRSGHDEKS
ncbi:hypothetical protein [Peribacillus simplex]|uniref:hypothetical protein n=1 Tax=Peribacillus simplex TaxID=1478 RepID=UPI003D2BAEBA